MTEYVKDFDKWNLQKKELENREIEPKFFEGDIWNCYIGVNVGTEESGKNDFLRPVILIRKYKEGFWCIPTSTRPQLISELTAEIDLYGVKSYAMINQILYRDKRRLLYKKGRISKKKYNEIIDKLIADLNRHRKK